MGNIIVAVLILAVLAGAVWYVLRAKKRGTKCIGCPDSGCCSGSCSGCKGCR